MHKTARARLFLPRQGEDVRRQLLEESTLNKKFQQFRGRNQLSGLKLDSAADFVSAKRQVEKELEGRRIACRYASVLRELSGALGGDYGTSVARKLLLGWKIADVLENYLDGAAVVGSSARGIPYRVSKHLGDLDLLLVPKRELWSRGAAYRKALVGFFRNVAQSYCEEFVNSHKWADKVDVIVFDRDSFTDIFEERELSDGLLCLFEDSSLMKYSWGDYFMNVLGLVLYPVAIINPPLFAGIKREAHNCVSEKEMCEMLIGRDLLWCEKQGQLGQLFGGTKKELKARVSQRRGIGMGYGWAWRAGGWYPPLKVQIAKALAHIRPTFQEATAAELCEQLNDEIGKLFVGLLRKANGHPAKMAKVHLFEKEYDRISAEEAPDERGNGASLLTVSRLLDLKYRLEDFGEEF